MLINIAIETAFRYHIVLPDVIEKKGVFSNLSMELARDMGCMVQQPEKSICIHRHLFQEPSDGNTIHAEHALMAMESSIWLQLGMKMKNLQRVLKKSGTHIPATQHLLSCRLYFRTKLIRC